MRKWNYPPEYLKKDGKLKKNCLKKAAEWRKKYPPKFLPETTFDEQIKSKNKKFDELLKSIPYPSYQHMNNDIIETFAEFLIGDISNNGMNSIEECDMFRAFCIMNKRLCLLNETFRKKYNIREKIYKCQMIYETEKSSNIFKKCPTNNWLPFNKAVTYNYNQNMELFHFLKSKYSIYFYYSKTSSDFKNCNYKIININPLVKTIIELNGKELEKNTKLCTDTELSGYNILFSNDEVRSGDLKVRNSSENIYIYRYMDLIKCFKKYPSLYEEFIVNLRRNYCKVHDYKVTKDIEYNIRYFIQTLLN